MAQLNIVPVMVAGSGSFLPGKPVPFDDADLYLGEITEAPASVQKWFTRIKPLMREMLDIEYYHYAIDPETRAFTEDNITMSVKAARKALEAANMKASEIDFIAYGSAHQDQMPTATVRIQEALGIEQCGEISIHANCTSAYKALLVAYEFIRTGRYKTALVLSSGISSSELRAEYYNQKVLRKEELFLRYFLCDGAGALVLRAAGEHEHGLFIENVMTESIGGLKPAAMLNTRPAYYMNPVDEYNGGHHHLAQMFNEQLRVHFHDEDGSVFIKGLKRLITGYNVNPSKIKFFQVNFPSKHISELIIDECAELGIDKGMLYSPMATMGYVGPPMVFICLDKILREETLVPGNLVLSFVTEVSKFMQAGFTLECR